LNSSTKLSVHNHLWRCQVLVGSGRYLPPASLVAYAVAHTCRDNRKSQIAIEYAYIYHERHPHAPVFWLHGSDPVRFEESYHHIARKMAFPAGTKSMSRPAACARRIEQRRLRQVALHLGQRR
jgi:hypothetical protein